MFMFNQNSTLRADRKLDLMNYNHLSDSRSYMANVQNINNCICI